MLALRRGCLTEQSRLAEREGSKNKNILSAPSASLPDLHNIKPRIRADKRIGPHNKLVLTIIFGSLLGDGYAERRIKGNGTRITFYQEGSHVSYLL